MEKFVLKAMKKNFDLKMLIFFASNPLSASSTARFVHDLNSPQLNLL